METLAALLTGLRTAGPKLLLAIAIASAILLFASDNFVAKLGATEFVNEHRSKIGVAMLLTAATSLVSAASYVANWVSKEANYWLGLRRHKKALLTLTRDEKAVLQKFIGGGETTRYAVLSDGIVAGLAARNILVRTSNLSGRHQTFPFNLQPWAREHLTKHPELLDE